MKGWVDVARFILYALSRIKAKLARDPCASRHQLPQPCGMPHLCPMVALGNGLHGPVGLPRQDELECCLALVDADGAGCPYHLLFLS